LSQTDKKTRIDVNGTRIYKRVQKTLRPNIPPYYIHKKVIDLFL